MRDISLLEQKKLQWAKEKAEELSKLNDFFTATTANHQFERTSIRTYYSNVEINSSSISSVKSNTIPRRASYYQENNGKDARLGSCRAYSMESPYENEKFDINHGPIRAPILPPIGRNNRQKPVKLHQNQFIHQNTDEDTSGYLSAGLSDRMSPQMWTKQIPHQSEFHHLQHNPHSHQSKDFSNYIYPSSGDELAPELDEMKIEERRRIPKHRPPPASEIDDNGHDTDFTMPKTPSSLCSDNRNYSGLLSCPPCRKDKDERAKWGDRSSRLYDSISKDSSIKSDGPCWLERGFADSGDESVRSYSFIRGQNAPIDPNILAERTSKRIKAIELQNAIKAQVEERERLRKIEQEKSLIEERRLEENLRQQRESNEQRFEEEQRILREKLEREQRKQEMMKTAIEKARQEAELERARKKRSIYMPNESETPKQHDDEILKTPTVDEMRTKNRIELSNSSNHTDDTDDTHDSVDDEKILIGTPIRMRKKTLNKGNKAKKEFFVQHENESNAAGTVATNATAVAAETNVDGIALVLQTLPPMMPILNNDIMSLNQNINNLNSSNYQLAVMLARQMQQLNSMAQNQNQRIEHSTNAGADADIQPPNQKDSENDVCKQCTALGVTDEKDMLQPALDDQCVHSTRDAATVTDDDFLAIVTEPPSQETLIDDMNRADCTQLTSDASTQTDQKQELCFQCRYHHCHHHHVVVKDAITDDHGVKTIAVNHANSKLKCLNKDCTNALNGHRSSCGEPKEPMKLEDRPKWGVNRPLQQYVKASERDPIYLRNKRKKHQKRQFIDDGDNSKEDSAPESRSTSPSPSIITNSTVTLSSPALKNRKRSVCTEILPIKTDMNGRVYLNFNGASLQVSEDEQRRPLLKQRHQKIRMINRSQTANDIRKEIDS